MTTPTTQPGIHLGPYEGLVRRHTQEEFAALKAGIARLGRVEVPLEVDDVGHLLDGHARWRAYQELRAEGHPIPFPPVNIHAGLSEAGKRDLVVTLNHDRRHLTPEERDELLRAERAGGKSMRQIAEEHGVGVATVHRAVSGVPSGTPGERVKGKDGKAYPSRRPLIVAKTRRELSTALSAIPRLDVEQTTGRLMDVDGLWSTVRKQERSARAAAEADAEIGSAHLYLGDFRERGVEIADESVHLGLCDLPYPKDDLHLWGEAASLFARVLRPGGLLAAYCGARYLPEVLPAMCAHLDYLWAGAVAFGGAGTRVYDRRMIAGCRLLLFFVRPGDTPGRWIHDFHQGGGQEKDLHEWQQGLPEAEALTKDLSDAGQVVLDPTMGVATFGVAAVKLGRHFTGIEIDPQTFADAEARIREAEAGGTP